MKKLVVKPTDGSGGSGIMIGPKAPIKEINEFIRKIKSKPDNYIAQPLEILSTVPTIAKDGIDPRHVDLRPFVLTGKNMYVTAGGLTRVALRKEVQLLIAQKAAALKIH